MPVIELLALGALGDLDRYESFAEKRKSKLGNCENMLGCRFILSSFETQHRVG